MLARQAAAAARRRAAGRPRKARAERVAIKKGGIPRSFTRKSHVSRERSGHHRARISRREIEIGRASCRERVWQYVKISVVAGYLKNKAKSKAKCSRKEIQKRLTK